jgi:hypothetical protein
MKTRNAYILPLAAMIFFASCAENEIDATYQSKGTATAMIASLSASKTSAALSEEIILTLKYRNPSNDPIQSVELKVKTGSADYTTFQRFDEGTTETGSEITRTVNYQLPGEASSIVFDMIITSQKKYPQFRRVTVAVK